MKRTITTLILSFTLLFIHAQVNLNYQEPPEEIKILADVPPTPSVLLDEKGEYMVLLHRSAFKSIDELSADEYRLAGIRINPKTFSKSRGRYYNSITIKKLKDKEAQLVKNLPEKALLSNFSWSQDYSKLAFTNQV
ncbi:MAG: S9 family peptidase, partial [Cyclobacteriaceae bacterium]|nr:S9 family peptidase [Cyclobacteriaceae bacterium]